MASKLFVNVPVGDLPRAIEFFTRLGFTFDQRYTDETAACMVVNDDAYFMLLTEKRFNEFTKKPICEKGYTEAIFALAVESRDKVDELVMRALAGGGGAAAQPQDLGFMYTWSFDDMDGHQWEVFWMDPAGPPAEVKAPSGA